MHILQHGIIFAFRNWVFILQKCMEYYFVCDLPAPLLTMYEELHEELPLYQPYSLGNVFYSTLVSILHGPKGEACERQFKILWWNDDPVEDDPVEGFTFF